MSSMLAAMRLLKEKMKEEAAAAEAAAASSAGVEVDEDGSVDGGHLPSRSEEEGRDLDPGLDSACLAAAKYVKEGKDHAIHARRRLWYEAEKCTPEVVTGILSSEDISRLHEAAAALGAQGKGTRHFKDSTAESTTGHTICYLHAEGYLQRAYSDLWEKIVESMRRRMPREWTCCDASDVLNVRCIELHTYGVGSGLLMENHRDNGSTLTMSALLSDDHDGGRFVTYRNGKPVAHGLAKGDAVLFPSEKLHNIERVTRGVRNALVVELWRPPTNTQDRFK